MVERNYFRMLSDEEASRYKFSFCKNCPFYECELIEEYMQFKKNHVKIQTSKSPMTVMSADSFGYTKGGGVVIQPVEVRAIDNEQDKKGFNHPAFLRSADTDSSDVDICSYDQTKIKDHCIMNRSVYQVECGRKNVTEGIGDHYKIETDDDYKIEKGTKDKWEPS